MPSRWANWHEPMFFVMARLFEQAIALRAEGCHDPGLRLDEAVLLALAVMSRSAVQA